MSKKRGLEQMVPQVKGTNDKAMDVVKKAARLDQSENAGSSYSTQSKKEHGKTSTPGSSNGFPDWFSGLNERVANATVRTPSPKTPEDSEPENSDEELEEEDEEEKEMNASDESEEGEEDVEENGNKEVIEVAKGYRNKANVAGRRSGKDLNKGMPKYMKLFDRVCLSSESTKALPEKYQGLLKMVNLPFSSATIAGEIVSKEVICLATELVRKSEMLHIASDKMLNFGRHKGVNLTERMLAYLTFLLVRIKRPSVDQDIFDRTSWLLDSLGETNVANILLNITKKEFVNRSLYMCNAKNDKPMWDYSEEFYDDIFMLDPSLHEDCILFLVALKENMESDPPTVEF